MIKRIKETVVYEQQQIVEIRSEPLWSFLLRAWFDIIHLPFHYYGPSGLCYAFNEFANWTLRFERIDETMSISEYNGDVV